MKKRVLSFLLMLCMLLSLLPSFSLASGAVEREALPRSEPTGLSSGGSAEKDESGSETRKKTDYDNLYVGADGAATANGGTLSVLLSVFGGRDASVSASLSTWNDKMGNYDATLIGGAYTETPGGAASGYWKRGASGGLHYDLDISGANVGIELPIEALPTGSYAIEWVAAVRGITAEGKGNALVETDSEYGLLVNEKPYIDLGPYHIYLYSGHNPNKPGLFEGNRFLDMYTNGAHTWYEAGPLCGWDHGGANFAVYYNTAHIVKGVSTNVTIKGDAALYTSYSQNILANRRTFDYIAVDSGKHAFRLFYGGGASVYSVRVYTAPLSAAEIEQNHFVDLAAYAGVNLTEYMALEPSARAVANALMANVGFSDDAEAMTEKISAVIKLLRETVDVEKTLYVTDGLDIFLSAFKSLHTGAIVSGDAEISWFNAVTAGEAGTLRGEGWTLKPDGGFTIVRSKAEYDCDRSFGLYLPGELLPEDEYTAEVVVTPTGLTVENEALALERYYDTETQYGVWHDHAFAIGPLRAMQWACISPSIGDAKLNRRWLYQRGDTKWDDCYQAHATDSAWKNVSMDETVTFSITLKRGEAEESIYSMYHGLGRVAGFTVAKENIITNAEGNNMFQFMVGMAGSIYSLRVYNRVLSEDEMLRNHMADLVYYYGLDTDLLLTMIDATEDASKIYRAFRDVDFSLSREEAQHAFEAAIAGLWISYAGTAIKNDMTDGMRYYFDVDASLLGAMTDAGYKIEVGALANIGKNKQPLYTQDGYDHKIVALTSDAGKTNGFFTDEDTFALTLFAKENNKETLLTDILVRGYVTVSTPSGEIMPLYVETTGGAYDPTSLFFAYSHFGTLEKMAEYPDVLERIDALAYSCYGHQYVYLDADAAEGGDGTEDAPFRYFEDAFERCRQILPTIGTPTYLYLQAEDGYYALSRELCLYAEDNPYAFSRFVITSKGDATLTTTRTLDESKFVGIGDNVYTYQFDTDEDGAYPRFRYLYVNGSLAEIAHRTGRRVEDPDIYLTVLSRNTDGVFTLAEEMASCGTLDMDNTPYDGSSLLLRAQFGYYRDLFMAYEEILEAAELGTLTFALAPAYAERGSVFYLNAFEEYKHYMLAKAEVDKILKSIPADNRVTDFPRATSSVSDSNPDDADLSEETIAAYLTAFEQVKQQTCNNSYLTNGLFPVIAALTSPVRTGVLAAAKEAYERGEKDVPPAYTLLLKEQYEYALEALRAFDDARLLHEVGELSLSTEGDGQTDAYLSCFEKYKLQLLAWDELWESSDVLRQKDPNGWKADFAALMPTREGASLDYKVTFLQMRDAAVDKDCLPDESIKPCVKESDLPYGGMLPFETSKSIHRIYLNVEAFGDLSSIMAQSEQRISLLTAQMKKEAVDTLVAATEALALARTAYEAKQSRAAEMLGLLSSLSGNEYVAYKKEYDRVIAQKEELYAALVKAQQVEKTARSSYLATIDEVNGMLSADYAARYNLANAGVEMSLAAEWDYNIVGLSGVDFSDYVVHLSGGKQTVHVACYLDAYDYDNLAVPGDNYFVGYPFFLQNALSYLDAEGEMYYDDEAGLLYYYTEKGVEDSLFEIPTLDYMLKLYNVKNVTVSDWTFTGTDDMFLEEKGLTGGQASGDYGGFPDRSAIWLDGCRGLTVKHCRFLSLPCEAITGRNRLENVTVEDCDFKDIGSSAIRLADPSSHWSSTKGSMNISMVNNDLERIATVYYASPAIQLGSSRNALIKNNTILYCSYSAISAGWLWAPVGWEPFGASCNLENFEVANNFFMHMMMELGDGAAVYTLGGNAVSTYTELFNSMHDNYIVFSNVTGDGLGHMHCGLYLDNSSTSFDTYNNVVAEQSLGAHEDDKGTAGMDERYLQRLRNRRNSSHYFYAQIVPNCEARNSLYRDNYVINVRATDAQALHKEAYRTYIVNERGIYERNTSYIRGVDNIPLEAEDIICASGCDRNPGTPDILYGNDY